MVAENQSTGESKPDQKGLSTGSKIGLGLCGGCLLLIIIFGLLFALAPVVLLKIFPEAATPEFFENLIENAIEEDTGREAEVNIDSDEGKWSVKDETGETSVEWGDEVEIPDDYPSDVPEYSNAQAINKTAVNEAKTVTFSTSDSVSEVASYFQDGLEDNDWEEVSSFDSTDVSYFTYEKNGRLMMVNIYSDGEETTFTVSYNLETEE